MRRASRQPGEQRERGGELREEAAHRVVAELVARRGRGELARGEVREAAARVGVGERTLWRWLAAGRSLVRGRPSRARLVLGDELRDAYLRLGGNAAAVWRERRDAGEAPPPLWTLQAAFVRELSPAERASARRGEAGRREHGLYLRYEAPHRNAVWQADHKQLPLLVVAPGGRGRCRPWVTLFLDDFSRAIMGWAISLRPSSAEVLAALRDALLVHAERGPFGGLPGRLRWDHGLEFAAGAVELAALALGIEVATALADQTPDPELAALIVVAVLARCPHYIRLANLRGLTSDGAALAGPWGSALTVPPELRRVLATWHHVREPLAAAGAMPLFPGNSHGRARQTAIRRRLARLDAPASLWEDRPDTTVGDGAHADGRALLLSLSAWHLWLDRRAHDAADSPPA